VITPTMLQAAHEQDEAAGFEWFVSDPTARRQAVDLIKRMLLSPQSEAEINVGKLANITLSRFLLRIYKDEPGT
jgi:hypothetical protein